MIATLLELLEYLVKLVDRRQSLTARMFDRVIHPAYTSTEAVVKQYFSLFAELRRLVRLGSTPEELLEVLERGRLEYLPVRDHLRALAARPSLWDGTPRADFVDGLMLVLNGGLSTYDEGHIPESDRMEPRRWPSHTLLDVARHVRVLPGYEYDESPPSLIDTINRQEEAVRAGWRQMSEAYAKLLADVAEGDRIT